ncbi:MAG: T3SS effector HopA1 family protein [Thermosynechococcaceae cyanobacterium MS004]|nr:T3SS effector HopA1 family protein [Thermosynechococcaceae cyanobacterium MS004]
MLSPISSPIAPEYSYPTPEGTRLMAVLEDIANSVELHSDFSLHHPHHESLELAPELVQSLSQITIAQQDAYLRWRISTYLYGLYDDGELPSPQASASNRQASESDLPIQNKSIGINSEFNHQLQHSNTGQGYFDPGWVALRDSADGLLVVKKDGLTMHVSRDRHLAEQSVTFGNSVSVRLPNSYIENGCYVAVGNCGPCPKRTNDLQQVNIYLNLTLGGILEALRELTTALNERSVPFSFAVPYELEQDQERCDAGVLTLERGAYISIQASLFQFYQSYSAQFRSAVPLFAKNLAPGLGLSEQPLNPFIPKESFMMHRFQILAEGMVSAWRQNLNDSQNRKARILQSLDRYQISLQSPYLNPGSKDVYALASV